jgi:hypothetical protein
LCVQDIGFSHYCRLVLAEPKRVEAMKKWLTSRDLKVAAEFCAYCSTLTLTASQVCFVILSYLIDRDTGT